MLWPVFLLTFLSGVVVAQEKPSLRQGYSVSFGTYLSSGNALPFWMTTNQNGAFAKTNSNYQLLRIGFQRCLEGDSLKKWGFSYGTSLIYGYGSKSDFQTNQYWIGSRYKWLVAEVGAKSNPVRFGGLSQTNGNMMWSNNARPLPGITLSTNGYIPFLFWEKWFSFYTVYEEKFLWDNRNVENAHLHHKSLLGRATFKKNWEITLGLDHWVFWGGTSPEFGKLPGTENYFRYILALGGGSTSPQQDQTNASGNSLGIYVLEVKKEFTHSSLTFYWNHPFEDRSGLEMDNIPDGLWGINFSNKNKNAFISAIVYEYMCTLNQSGTYNWIPASVPGTFTGRGNDNYFNNGVYRSGYVHYNQTIGTPVFIPVIENGISTGFNDTRIESHHIGISGSLSENLKWKSLLTLSKGFGTYDINLYEPKNQVSFLAELKYHLQKAPVSVNIGIAGDYGGRLEKRVGGYAGLSWTF